MIGLKNIYKLMHVIILGFAFFAPNAHAQIPVVDFASISNGAKDIVNTVKESKLVMDATALASKANAAIGEAKKNMSEYVLANKEKIEKKAEKLKKYQEKIEKAKKQAEEYKKYAESKVAEAEKFKNDVQKEVDKAKEFKKDVEGTVQDAKSAVNDVKGQIDSAKATVNDVKGQINDAKETVNAVKGQIDDAKSAVDSKIDTAKNAAGIQSGSSSSAPSYANVGFGNAQSSAAAPVSSAGAIPSVTAGGIAGNIGSNASASAPAASQAKAGAVKSDRSFSSAQQAMPTVENKANAIKSAPMPISGATNNQAPTTVNVNARGAKTMPMQRSMTRGGFKNLDKAAPMTLERQSSIFNQDKFAFAFSAGGVKMGTTKDGVFIFPQILAFECNIDTDDVKKEGVMDECLNSIMKRSKSAGVEGQMALEVYSTALQQMAAAYIAESMQSKNDASDKEEKVIDPINEAPSTTDMDGTAILNQMTTELVKTMNTLMSAYSSKLGFDAMKAYGDYELSPYSLDAE